MINQSRKLYILLKLNSNNEIRDRSRNLARATPRFLQITRILVIHRSCNATFCLTIFPNFKKFDWHGMDNRKVSCEDFNRIGSSSLPLCLDKNMHERTRCCRSNDLQYFTNMIYLASSLFNRMYARYNK